jgi:GT2 family glycosyltransferase
MKNTISSLGSPLVSIIILNWNGWRDTIRCLDSLQKLEFASHQIIVVDNGSTDDSCFQIESAYPKIKLLRSDSNLGFGGGCNIGIRYALAHGADFIWLLNNDTVVQSVTLSALVNQMHSDPYNGAVGSVLFYMNNPNAIQAWGGGYVNFLTGRSTHCFSPVDPNSLNYLTAASILLRKEALEEVGIFDEKSFFMYWEDVDLCYRLRNDGWKLDVAPGAKVLHQESGSLGAKNSQLYRYYSASVVQFFKQHSKVPFIPISIAIGGKTLKMLFSGNVDLAMATISGLFSALSLKKT